MGGWALTGVLSWEGTAVAQLFCNSRRERSRVLLDAYFPATAWGILPPPQTGPRVYPLHTEGEGEGHSDSQGQLN